MGTVRLRKTERGIPAHGVRSPMPGRGLWGVALILMTIGMYGCSATHVIPWNPVEPPTQTERPVGGVYFYCNFAGMPWLVTPCEKHVELRGMEESRCPDDRGSYELCGHVLAHHQPQNPRQAQNATDVIGYIRDELHEGPTFYLPGEAQFYEGCSSGPVAGRYRFEYMAGQAMGVVTFRLLARTIRDCPQPGDRWRFISRQEDPASCCEVIRVLPSGEQECECSWKIEVRLTDWDEVRMRHRNRLEELPAPRLQTWVGPAPYVRCGRIDRCNPNVDSPHTWDAHRAVHWGLPEMNRALECLARHWFVACSRWYGDPPPPEFLEGSILLAVEPQNLVITDMSLPGGGLLDIAGRWRSPHTWHRQGRDADLVGLSVPADGRCGPRPTGTYDERWKDTRLWDEEWTREVWRACGIHALDNDPGHIRLGYQPRRRRP